MIYKISKGAEKFHFEDREFSSLRLFKTKNNKN